MFTRLCGFVALLFSFYALGGCGDNGPKAYRISGEALFDGQPIPHGDVLFTPDGSQQNSGAQGFANIKDGKFDTAVVGGKPLAGGPTVIRVTGLSGPGGKLLCEYEYKLDLPRADSTITIEVPAKAAPKKVGPSKEI